MKSPVYFGESSSYTTRKILRVPVEGHGAEMHMRAIPKPGAEKDPMSFFDEKEVTVHLPPTYDRPVPLYVVDDSGQPLPWDTPLTERPEASYNEVLSNAMRYNTKVILDVRETHEMVVQLVGKILAVGNVVVVEDDNKSVTTFPIRALAYVTEFEHEAGKPSPLWSGQTQQRIVTIRGRSNLSISAAFSSEMRVHSSQTLPTELLENMWSGSSQTVKVVRSLRLVNSSPYKLSFDEIHLEMEPRLNRYHHRGGVMEVASRSLSVASRHEERMEEESIIAVAAKDAFVDIINQGVSVDTMSVSNIVPRMSSVRVLGIAVVGSRFTLGLYMNIVSEDLVAPGRLDFGVPSMAYTMVPHVLKPRGDKEKPDDNTAPVRDLSEEPLDVKHTVSTVLSNIVVSKTKDMEKTRTTDRHTCVIKARQDVSVVISPAALSPSYGQLVSIASITIGRQGQEHWTIKGSELKSYRGQESSRISIAKKEFTQFLPSDLLAADAGNFWFEHTLKAGEEMTYSFTRTFESEQLLPTK